LNKIPHFIRNDTVIQSERCEAKNLIEEIPHYIWKDSLRSFVIQSVAKNLIQRDSLSVVRLAFPACRQAGLFLFSAMEKRKYNESTIHSTKTTIQ
tara:strand:+ start:164522 stop:164806 length:285 start_codon:yes stop_codon:yes gene_type:complete